MRAPVYRNIEAKNTLLGLSFPTEVFAVSGVYWLAIVTAGPAMSLVATAAATVAIRVIGYGRAPQFIQHYLSFMGRRLMAGGRLSTVARVKTPRFPHAPHVARDLPRRGEGSCS